jgi:murein DD-endopeptidase MepM/ murein hydrolase activator NlpD
MILWVVLALVVVFAIGAFIINMLSVEVDDINAQKQRLEKSKEQLVFQQIKLQNTIEEKSKILLSKDRALVEKNEAIDSMNEHLAEIEKLIDVEPDLDAAFYDRIKVAKVKTIKKIKKGMLSANELALLNRSIPNGKPIRYKRVSATFGYRTHPITHKRQFHTGIDLAARTGTKIYATADGVVEYAKNRGGYGKLIMIDHSFGFKTIYGHLSRYAVKSGDYVMKGDLIGYVGSTGRSTGPHLHYEVRYLQKWLNPKKYIHWSSKNYTATMNSEKLVNWRELLSQIRNKMRIYSAQTKRIAKR